MFILISSPINKHYLFFTTHIARTAEHITNNKPIREKGFNAWGSLRIMFPVGVLFKNTNPARKEIPARTERIFFVFEDVFFILF